ncbi:MAG TPA: hypothetical protein VFI46_04850 [Jiangellaceae bacterium]|nr:hypothetical protein [Jiangellaceae bacterium]
MVTRTLRVTHGGYWVTWDAEVRSRPDVDDPVSYLRDGLRVLRDHPHVADATCRYRRRHARVEFDVQIPHALTPDFALVRANVALRESLARAGLSTEGRPAAGGVPMATVRLERGPLSIQRA